METSVTLPTMHDDELLKRADQFAENLVSLLNQFNEEYPRPMMDDEAWQRLHKKHGDKIPGPTPQQMIGTFRNVFCQYMLSRYAIVPPDSQG